MVAASISTLRKQHSIIRVRESADPDTPSPSPLAVDNFEDEL